MDYCEEYKLIWTSVCVYVSMRNDSFCLFLQSWADFPYDSARVVLLENFLQLKCMIPVSCFDHTLDLFGRIKKEQ